MDLIDLCVLRLLVSMSEYDLMQLLELLSLNYG